MASPQNPFLDRLDAAELEDGQPAGFRTGESVAHPVGSRHLDERLELLVHALLGARPMKQPVEDGGQAMQQCHAPSSTLVMANATRSHRSRCCSSWRRPAGVSR